MGRQKIVFISGPYRAHTLQGVIDNIRRAEKMALKYWKQGYAVICPHKNTALFDGECKDEVWLQGDMTLLAVSDILVLTSDWMDSEGANLEYYEALRLNKSIIIEEEDRSK